MIQHTEKYEKAQSAKIGEKITCPGCGKQHTKTTYHKIFCSNGKTKGAGNCKDRYWNVIDPNKRDRDTPYRRTQLARQEASNDFDDDPSWDSHKMD